MVLSNFLNIKIRLFNLLNGLLLFSVLLGSNLVVAQEQEPNDLDKALFGVQTGLLGV